MFVVTVQAHYDSAHYLRHYHGKCERMHGHRYVVEVALGTDRLDEAGISFDFVAVKRELRALAEYLDHQNLNELPPFDRIEPSAEEQARWFHGELKQKLPAAMAEALIFVKVWETPTQYALYTERQLWL
ncbi:MAG: 6-carboxytetrahydropterin synthase [Gemmatimonadetes bacterium]|nr:6-carboxytetrahydropterin synthase [Gemmatimonadota bacterium]